MDVFLHIYVRPLLSFYMFMWNLSFHAGTTAIWRKTSQRCFPQSSEGCVTLEELEKRLFKSHTLLKSGSTEAQPDRIQQPGLCTLILKSCTSEHLSSGFSFDVNWLRPISLHTGFLAAGDLLLSLENTGFCLEPWNAAQLSIQGQCWAGSTHQPEGKNMLRALSGGSLGLGNRLIKQQLQKTLPWLQRDSQAGHALPWSSWLKETEEHLTAGEEPPSLWEQGSPSQRQARTHTRDIQKRGMPSIFQSSLPPGTSSFSHSWKEKKSVSQAAVLGVPSHWQALGWFKLGVVHIVLKTWWTHTFSSPMCLEWGQTA